VSGHVQLAEGGHVDDGDDQAEHKGRQLIGQSKEPEEERHGGQLDANAGEEQCARPELILRAV